MNNFFNNPNNQNWNKNINHSQQKKPSESKRDEDLIIEENTIYEIDRNCVERLKRNRKRII